MNVKIEGLSEVKSYINRLKREEIPKAFEITINKTMGQMKTRLTEEIKSSFDRPKSWSVNTLFIDPVKASKGKYTSSLNVRRKNPQGTTAVQVLGHHISGGTRTMKGYEKWMISKGYMHNGQFIVPGPHASIDKFGNQTRAEINKIMKALSTGDTPGGWKYFISDDGKTVFSVKGKQLKLLWFIVENVNYDKRYGFFPVGMETAKKMMLANAEFAVQKAIERR